MTCLMLAANYFAVDYSYRKVYPIGYWCAARLSLPFGITLWGAKWMLVLPVMLLALAMFIQLRRKDSTLLHSLYIFGALLAFGITTIVSHFTMWDPEGAAARFAP